MEGQCLHHKQLAVIQKFLPNSLRNDVMPGPPKNGPDLHGERQGFLAKTFGKHGSAPYSGTGSPLTAFSLHTAIARGLKENRKADLLFNVSENATLRLILWGDKNFPAVRGN